MHNGHPFWTYHTDLFRQRTYTQMAKVWRSRQEQENIGNNISYYIWWEILKLKKKEKKMMFIYYPTLWYSALLRKFTFKNVVSSLGVFWHGPAHVVDLCNLYLDSRETLYLALLFPLAHFLCKKKIILATVLESFGSFDPNLHIWLTWWSQWLVKILL